MNRTIKDLREAFARGEGRGLHPEVAHAQFDLGDHALGSEWDTVPLDAVAFEQRFPCHPEDSEPLIGRFGGLRLYLIWRSALLRLIIAQGGGAQEDVWNSLRTHGRIAGIKNGLSDIRKPIEHAFGANAVPRDITREMAIEADSQVAGAARNRLRSALRCLDELRKLPEVLECGLLGKEPIGPMPKYRSAGHREMVLPPTLRKWCEGLPISQASATKLVFEIGVDAGIFELSEDISPRRLVEAGTFAALCKAVRAKHTAGTAKQYLQRLKCAVLGTSVNDEDRDGWSKLTREARWLAPETDLNPLSNLKSVSNGREPWELDQAWFDEVSEDVEMSRKRSALRRGIRVLELLREQGHEKLHELLPPEPIRLEVLRSDKMELPDYLTAAIDTWRDQEAPSGSVDKKTQNALRFLWKSTRAAGLKELLEPRSIDTTFLNASELKPIVLKQYRTAAHRFRAAMFREASYEWEILLQRASELDFSKKEIHGLGALRHRALSGSSPRHPRSLDCEWIAAARNDITAPTSRRRFERGVETYDALRRLPELRVAKIFAPPHLEPTSPPGEKAGRAKSKPPTMVIGHIAQSRPLAI